MARGLEYRAQRAVLIFLTLLALSFMISAAAPQAVIGRGNVDCGKWLDSRQIRAANVLEHFALGIINGMALGSGVDIWGNKQPAITHEQFYLFVDKHCRENPLGNIYTASGSFANAATGFAYQRRVEAIQALGR